MAFGEKLRDLRLKSGMTQLQLADKVNVTKSVISYYEHKDKKNPLYTAGCSSGNPGRDGGKYVSGASSVNPCTSAVRKRRFPGFTGGHRGWYSEY